MTKRTRTPRKRNELTEPGFNVRIRVEGGPWEGYVGGPCPSRPRPCERFGCGSWEQVLLNLASESARSRARLEEEDFMPNKVKRTSEQGGQAGRGQSKDNQNGGQGRQTGRQSRRQAGQGGQGRGNKPRSR
jgi:hypothetical protein